MSIDGSNDCDVSREESLASMDHCEGLDMDLFHELVHKQAGYSKEDLHAMHRQWLGPRGVFATFGEEIEQLGRQAPALDDLKKLTTPERLQDAEQAVAFALAQNNRRISALNPFMGLRREALCAVVFDDTGTYALVERYAAYQAIRQSDADVFIKLIATTRGVVERRIVFRGLLEHYDRLLPIEKSIYPDGYRSVQQGHLDREEALYGRLPLEGDVLTLLRTMSAAEMLKRVQPPARSPV